MSLRTRLLLAFAALVLIPFSLLAFGLRRTITDSLSAQYDRRLREVTAVIHDDLRQESAAIDARLASLELALQMDNDFRLGAIARDPSRRNYVLEYAVRAMALTGLSMLQIQDADGRIISSGHFRNEHDRLEPQLPAALQDAEDIALVSARSPEGTFIALARAEPLQIGGRPFTLVGGIAVDRAFLERLARDRDIVVSLEYPGGELTSAQPGGTRTDASAGTATAPPMPIAFLRTAGEPALESAVAQLTVSQPLTGLQTLLRRADTLLLITIAGTGVTALLLAVWVSSRISRPLAALAEKTAVLDLDRLDVQFDGGSDEVGRLSELLGDLASRLRTSSARIREAERRATVGDLARQINHDIKNGLIPLRNVMRHLTEVGRDDPASLAAVLGERRQTIDSSIAYLETLATNYERLSLPANRRDCDLNALVSDAVRGMHGYEGVDLRIDLAPQAPRVTGDPIAIRRILENLVANALESLPERRGRITISTQMMRDADTAPVVRLMVADTGQGMSQDETSRIFADFYTTKPGGTGLGLSIVRRLVMDLHARLHVESEPGAGTRMIVDIPAAGRTSPPSKADLSTAAARTEHVL